MTFTAHLPAVELTGTSPLKGKPFFDLVPYLHPVAEALDDASVPLVLVEAANSTGKTLLHVQWLRWLALNRPGNVLTYTAEADKADTLFWVDHLQGFYESEPVLRSLKRRMVQGGFESVFGNFHRVLSANEGNTNSYQVATVTGTECHLWRPGILAAALLRLKAAGAFASGLLESTGAKVQHEFSVKVAEATREAWHNRCLRCTAPFRVTLLDPEHPSEFSGVLRFDPDTPSEWRRPGGVHIVCPSCGHPHTDTRRERLELSLRGCTIAKNPRARNRSFTWSALDASWNPLAVHIEEYFSALAVLEGDDEAGEAMQNFICKREGFSFTGELPTVRGFALTVAPGFEGEKRRFIGVDVQGEGEQHFWMAVVDVSRDGLVHVVDYQRVESLEAVRKAQVLHGVPFHRVAIDRGWSESLSEVKSWSATWGWLALKASTQEEWNHAERGLSLSRPWSLIKDSQAGGRSQGRARVDVRKVGWCQSVDTFSRKKNGKQVVVSLKNRNPLFAAHLDWSKDYFSSLLKAKLRSGQVTVSEGLAEGAEFRKQVATRARGKDHARDCLEMVLVLVARSA